jgi:hypothetical protein
LVCAGARVFLLYFDGIDYVFALFSGRLRIDDLLSFEFVAPVVFPVVRGWLLQCAIVIVFYWIHGNARNSWGNGCTSEPFCSRTIQPCGLTTSTGQREAGPGNRTS